MQVNERNISHQAMARDCHHLMRKGLSGMHIFRDGRKCPHPGNCQCRNLESNENIHWAKFSEEMARQLMPFFMKALGNQDDARDAIIETFVRFFRSIENFQLDKPLSPYIWGIARSVRYDFLKSRKAGVEVPIDDETERKDFHTNPYQLVDSRMYFIELAQRARLSEVQTKVVYLTFFENLPPRDIACVLQISSKVVRNELLRAKKKIRAILQHL